MDPIDEFQSMFKRAEREPFQFEEPPLRSVTLVTDGDRSAAEDLRDRVAGFLPVGEAEWRLLCGNDFSNVSELLQKLEDQPADLLVTLRCLQEESLVPQHSLGVYVDVLTQVAPYPVLLLPGTALDPLELPQGGCDRVMVVTDHISGDDRLVNWGVRACRDGGTLWMCHVEDDLVFARYVRAIEEIPQIDTEPARRLIGQQLLKQASDFIDTCVKESQQHRPELEYERFVGFGHHVTQYRQTVDEHGIKLLVANTKDAGQLAMHGQTYSLSVELLSTPLLLL